MKVRPYTEVRGEFIEGSASQHKLRRAEGDTRPLRGWYTQRSILALAGSAGEDVIFQHQLGLGSIHHVAVCKDDGTPIYDQPLHFERPGAITVVVNSKQEFGLVQVDRPIFKNMAQYDYENIDFSQIGRGSWEVPRGMAKKGESAAETAKREAGEEINSPIESLDPIGLMTPGNTTFLPHLVPVWLCQVNEDFGGEMPKDVNEKIFKVTYFNREEISEMILESTIVCPLTIAAISKAEAYLHAQHMIETGGASAVARPKRVPAR